MPDTTNINHGRKWVVTSLACAVLALFIAPVIFGPLGIVSVSVAVWNGTGGGGTVGGSGGRPSSPPSFAPVGRRRLNRRLNDPLHH